MQIREDMRFSFAGQSGLKTTPVNPGDSRAGQYYALCMGDSAVSQRRRPSVFSPTGFRNGPIESHHDKIDHVSKVVPARVLGRGEAGKIDRARERFI